MNIDSQDIHQNNFWGVCPQCKGRGTLRGRLSKKARLQYKTEVEKHKQSNADGPIPQRPKAQIKPCKDCSGSGLSLATAFPKADPNSFPHIAIIGAGIGGVALAVACLHRGIPFTLYERDQSFDQRSQGYGLTLQQASKAIKGFGLSHLKDGIVSSKHIVHTTDGKVIGEWGMRKWVTSNQNIAPKRSNLHIARQALRLSLLNQLKDDERLKWGHQLMDYKKEDHGVNLNFKVNGNITKTKADLLVGADGIRSAVRQQLIGEKLTPLRYLDCMVILGICNLEDIKTEQRELLDSATVFQTANGKERIYMMPFDKQKVMWQLSFPMSEADAKSLSKKGSQALKTEAYNRTPWHEPIPQIIEASSEHFISGYPVYDRTLIKASHFDKELPVTLIGDAAHPMSPFKGQGANQALLDALSLARTIYSECRRTPWKTSPVLSQILESYQSEMLGRSAQKVKDSAEAANFLHSDIVLQEQNAPRGTGLKKL
ncbi:MAG: monooxygenase [Bacteroidetes bacterium MedPE-SWsnd-G2]|nr:MAG: monooxygenase [Bacteroidetes bacterium MedPE-SWsnd-G2]